MARKTTIVTRQEIEGEQAELQPETTETEVVTDEEAEIAAFLNNLGGGANHVKIFKIVNGERQYCGSAELSVVNEDYILKNYQGGRYLIQATSNSKYIKGGSRQFTIYEPPFDPSNARAKTVDNSVDIQVQILRDQIASQQQLLLQILNNNAQAKGPTAGEMLGMMRDLQAMTKQPDVISVLSPLMGLMKESMEIARDTAGGGDGKTDWMGLVGKAMDKLPAIVGSLAMSRSGHSPAVSATEPEKEIEEDPKLKSEFVLKQGIAFLKEKALKGKDPELQADIILDNFDQPETRTIGMQILNMPFEDFAKYDPDILKEPLHTWFKRVYDCLREGFTNANNAADPVSGTGGSGADPE